MALTTIRKLLLIGIAIVASSCATFTTPADRCPPGTQQLENCPPLDAVADGRTEQLYRYRTWIKYSDLNFDPTLWGKHAEIPVKSASAKFLGPRREDALNSIAAKIWLIENAQHTIDMMYYIYAPDLIGKALLGALCDAVARGVDVRFTVDALGSFMLGSDRLRALESCRVDAGFMRSADGTITTSKARVQTVVFNALTKFNASPNRRSHDKLIAVDGFYHEKALVITGGRNISLDYYGINADGSPNLYAYRDAEILLRPGKNSTFERSTVGEVSEIYFSLLNLFKSNKRVRPTAMGNPGPAYAAERREFRDSLAKLKSLSAVRERLDAMPEYMNDGFIEADVRLAHEFGNLIDKNVVVNAIENRDRNPNSITRILAEADDNKQKHVRLVSPYIFLARYTNKDGTVVTDGAAEIRKWLEADPERTVKIVTNSILTSDNGGAQSVIDMDMAPRLLLSEEMQKAWLDNPNETEFDEGLATNTEWLASINNPRLAVYQTGRSDSSLLGGDDIYAKLHAKYIVTDAYGFVGTANFDYRSRLFNNEMGFFFRGDQLLLDMKRDFDFLVSRSYRWGSPEWLEMRKKLREGKGAKARSIRGQRRTYKFLRATGLKWWF